MFYKVTQTALDSLYHHISRNLRENANSHCQKSKRYSQSLLHYFPARESLSPSDTHSVAANKPSALMRIT